ncbi:MAG TPA: carboxypeptidase-like regulatory domain-containing protein [Candidatus Acidoferrales bacterium]|nr:carboxypeptidase-like regulatory domain-containing protein [Candidatus Acidoferrales bacterium]
MSWLRRLALTAIVALSLFAPKWSQGQTTGSTLSGTVTDSAGKPVRHAKVTVKNEATGESSAVQTDESGAYQMRNMEAGDYEVTVSADGMETKVTKLTIAAGIDKTLDIALSAASTPQTIQNGKPVAPPEQGAKTPAGGTEPSLSDLGFPSTEVQGNAKEQARLDKRSHMLQIHQRLGLITIIPLTATVVSGAFAGGKVTSSRDRYLHAALGSATAGLYIASASYAIFAPKIHGTKAEGPIRWHKALAWIHGPGMILTPILGEMAFVQRSSGKKVHGIAKLHGQVAIVTAAAYGAAVLSVTIKSGSVSRSAKKVAAAFGLKRSKPIETYTDREASGSQ